MTPPIDGIQLFFTAEFLRGRHWLLAYRRAAYGAARFFTAAIFLRSIYGSRGKLIGTRSPLQLILLLIRESGLPVWHGSLAFLSSIS